uniref:Uncharacterized protein n=1 Tax=Avena sativa TaxID=4498 RepID=A0ACD5XT67_AVESA
MGNCLVIQDRKEINVMSVVDGEILKALPAPPSKGDADADALPAGDMGQLYRLFPAAAVKAPSAAADDQGAVVRVKLVISKQELRRMLGKDEQALSMDDMVTLMRRRSEEQQRHQQISCCRGWRPALHSIPEGSGDLFY